MVVLLYYLLSMFVDVRDWYFLWLGLIGLTMGFHFSFTLLALSDTQSDIQIYGRVFSYTVIYLLNMLMLGILIVIVSPSTTIELFVKRLMMDMIRTWEWCGSALLMWSQHAFYGLKQYNK